MYSIVIKKQASKGMLQLPRKIAEKFRLAFKELAVDPYNTGYDIKKLSDREGYRLRISSYRAIYAIDAGQLVILVVKVGPRGDIYK